MALLLLGQRDPGSALAAAEGGGLAWPPLWRRHAASLLGLGQDFEGHPYASAWRDRAPGGPSSAEPELIAAQAKYVRTVYGCMRDTLKADEFPPELDEGLFLLAWLCLLTRRFQGPQGSALVPGIDFLNHSASPNASSDWDEESGSVEVRALVDLGEGDEVLISYGNLSNPLLWRTYGFTLPPRAEPSWTCTFSQEELSAASEAAEELEDLPNLHLDSSRVTDELAVTLQASDNAGKWLRNALLRRLEHAPGRFLSELPLDADDNLTRVELSEHLCLLAHLDILDELSCSPGHPAARLPAELRPRQEDLQRELALIQQAGLLALS